MKNPSINTMGARLTLIILTKLFLVFPFNRRNSLIDFITYENNLLKLYISLCISYLSPKILYALSIVSYTVLCLIIISY